MMQFRQNRRDFLASLSAAGAASFLDIPASLAVEGQLETNTIRLRRDPGICVAPLYVAEDLLHAEGFTDIRYVPLNSGLEYAQAFERGELDLGLFFAGSAMLRVDGGLPITALAGVHLGCFELFAHEPIQTISDLKGKTFGVDVLGSDLHIYVAIMAAHVGLDPERDVKWVAEASRPKRVEMFVAGEVDAFLGAPPQSQELRARKIGRVILNTTTDKPWSHYFCCMLWGNRDFVRDHPIATKRVLRALLKANDICAAEPQRVAQLLIDGGYTEQRYDYVLQTLTELPYASWREFDPEDSLRFFALRLHEIGMIKSSPNALIAENADWRFLNELKRELKA
jgi:NitT/TauT family transport system substrate-binding protein